MDKKEYLRQLLVHDRAIKQFKKKWPNPPPPDSPDDIIEMWHADWIKISTLFPNVNRSFLRWNQDDEFVRTLPARNSLWLDPIIPKRARQWALDEQNKIATNEEKKLLLAREKTHDERTPEEISKLRRMHGEKYLKTAAMAIPIYPDTSREDIEQLWPEIERLKKILYGKRSAPKKNKWETNIEIYKFGQNKETFEEITGKPYGSWENLARQLGISPQACRERYNGIKSVLDWHTRKREDNTKVEEDIEAKISALDCKTCERRKECKSVNFWGDCPILDELLGKGEVSTQSHIRVEDIEEKKARETGPWESQNSVLDNLFDPLDSE